MRVGVVSLGCSKNRVDTEQMLSLLKAADYEIVADAASADVIIVNTCGFIDAAKEESIDTILEMAESKKTGSCKLLMVTGCLAQRYGDALLADMPEIDGILGVNDYADLPKALSDALSGKRPRYTKPNYGFLENTGRVLTTPKFSAYVKIGDGCDNRCAYCAIPLIRGHYRSRKRADILAEMRFLAESGVREQTLIAQDTTRYGSDFTPRDSLASLMDEAAGISGIDMLRVLYCYPDETTDELLEVMEKHKNISRYLDLPLQHISDRLLKAMNRRGNAKSIRETLKKARERGFCLRTTLIVGFPDETDEDFDELIDFVRETEFDRLGAFTFSPEEGTAAAEMDGQIPDEVKQARLSAVMELQAKISKKRDEMRVGSSVRAIVIGSQNGLYLARSDWEAPETDGVIYLRSDKPLSDGDICSARITGTRGDYDLEGERE
ncbi:MAG: 30S ribosomal protein S12 methylthiotransferase RimO [Eubacteriales bacterium]|nr:30S ribosomal protein S12 methylthiotransferase RimO [Eubacteriales bacterium]MDD3881065.1 30S ribosomal protein S12 methylthiotransferase RimO [Eubacteriales bacterium]MDD4511866.1 30S ribosomal protein S12 methylthiotransferase RimO [Eubacteriales bacterium]